MDKPDRIQLYADALYWHYINKGYSEWRARAEADRIISKKDKSALV